MGMSIAERMAMQARIAAASHRAPIKSAPAKPAVSGASRIAKQSNVARATSNGGKGAPPEPKKAPASMTAAQRMARQGSVSRQDSAKASNIAPPPPAPKTATMSAADRIQKQAIVASAQKHGEKKVEVNKDFLNKLKAEYAEYVKKLMAELDKEGPMFFTPKAEPPKAEPAVEEKVNGISTAEGEMVIEAEPSAQVPGMPFQATPVITAPEVKRAARKSRKKAESAPAEQAE